MRARLAARLSRVAHRVWQGFRRWSGDAAYETYLSRANGGPRLSRKAFYLESLQRRYREPNRCC